MEISTALDEFQAAMQQLLGDLPYVRITIGSFEEHLGHLWKEFTLLQDAGLVTNT